MESDISTLKQNMKCNTFVKHFKEDNLIPSNQNKIRKLSINPIKKFVPVIKPKKSFIIPSPFQLNPESSNKNSKYKIFAFDKNTKNINFESFNGDSLSSFDCSDFSNTEEEDEIEIEKNKNDISTEDKSPIFKFKDEYDENSF